MAVAEVLDALADKNRRNILLKLKEGKISSGDLAIALGMTPQALSYHLAKLKKADLIYEIRSHCRAIFSSCVTITIVLPLLQISRRIFMTS